MTGRPRCRARVAAGFVAVAVGLLGVRALRARSSEALLGTGEAVLRHVRALHAEHVDRVVVNGLAARIATGESADLPSAVLDQLRSACGAPPAEELAAGATAAARATWRVPLLAGLARAAGFDGSFRAERGGLGAMACFEGARWGLPDAVGRFLRTGDLSTLGRFRLAFAQRGETSTTYVVVWLEGRVVLEQAFPASGDAPGADVSDVPRPPSSRRLLSVSTEGSTEGGGSVVALYATPSLDAASCLAFEAASLGGRGWRVERRGTGLLVRRQSATVVVHAAPDGTGATLVVMAL